MNGVAQSRPLICSPRQWDSSLTDLWTDNSLLLPLFSFVLLHELGGELMDTAPGGIVDEAVLCVTDRPFRRLIPVASYGRALSIARAVVSVVHH